MASSAPAMPAKLPAKGITMAEVEKQFGTPRAKQPTVGGDTPKHPPITRWDYDGFVVIFERDRVVDAVVPGAPPPVFHKDQLKQKVARKRAAAPAPAAPVASPAPASTEPAATEPAAAPPSDAPAASDSAPAPSDTAPSNVATPDNPNPDRPAPPQ